MLDSVKRTEVSDPVNPQLNYSNMAKDSSVHLWVEILLCSKCSVYNHTSAEAALLLAISFSLKSH